MKINYNSEVLLLSIPVELNKESQKLIGEYNSMPPLGLLYIYSFLSEHSYVSSFIDLTVEKITMEAFTELLKRINPKVIGMTSYVEAWNVQLKFCEYLKSVLKDVKIVLGGHLATFSYEELFKYDFIDYVICREGEFSMVKLCDYLINNKGNINDIENLIYKKGDSIFKNKLARRIENLDALPVPDRTILDQSKYAYPLTISTARGCPGKCIFCSSAQYLGNKVVLRSAENIVEEIIQEYERTGEKTFFIVDDTFTVNKSRVKEFCNLLNNYARKENIKFEWGCESRVDVVDEELLFYLHESGCLMMQFGMESGNDEVLMKINKNITFEQVYNAVKLATAVKIRAKVSIIIGHYCDTIKTVEETFEKALFLKREFNSQIVFSINTLFPGTEQFEKMTELQMEFINNPLDNVSVNKANINTKNFQHTELDELFHYIQIKIK